MTYKTSNSLTQNDLEHPASKQNHYSWSVCCLFRYFPPTTLTLAIIVFIFWGGFIIFSEQTEQLIPPTTLPKADAIIVLTGGEHRIETGIHLLQKGFGSRLLITGVNTSTNLKSFMHNMHISPRLISCCIDIGHQAINTRGNAEESASWIKKHHYKTLYIVTHDYHIRRSMRELKYLMPDIHFIAYPVKKSKAVSTIQQIKQTRILLFQYIKTLQVYIRTAF